MEIKKFNNMEIKKFSDINEEFSFDEQVSSNKISIKWAPIDEEEGVALGGGFYYLEIETSKGSFFTEVQKKGGE